MKAGEVLALPLAIGGDSFGKMASNQRTVADGVHFEGTTDLAIGHHRFQGEVVGLVAYLQKDRGGKSYHNTKFICSSCCILLG